MFRVYIAGPMAGMPGHGFAAFHHMAALLRIKGHDVVNPAENITHEEMLAADQQGIAFKQTQTYKDYLKQDLLTMLTCDAIQLLPKWEHSTGANLELFVARTCGLQIWVPNQPEIHVDYLPGELRSKADILAKFNKSQDPSLEWALGLSSS